VTAPCVGRQEPRTPSGGRHGRPQRSIHEFRCRPGMVKIRMSPSMRTSVTRPGSRRLCAAPTSAIAVQASSGRTPTRTSTRTETTLNPSVTQRQGYLGDLLPRAPCCGFDVHSHVFRGETILAPAAPAPRPRIIPLVRHNRNTVPPVRRAGCARYY